MTIKNVLLPLLRNRLKVYSRFMNCKPSPSSNLASELPGAVNLRLSYVQVPTLVMLSGFWYEKHVGWLSYARLRKHVGVADVENVLRLAHLSGTVVPIPCTDYQNLFDCDVQSNIVYEVWAPRINPIAIEVATKGRLVFFSPDVNYVRNFTSLIRTISTAVKGSEEAYVYAVSKFSYPGFLGRFLESFSDVPETRLVLATSSNNVKEAVERNYSNVTVVTTKSHRKLLLILVRLSENEWEVLGFHGSMNVFAPGTDDYMVYANDFSDLSIVVHGILRALLVI